MKMSLFSGNFRTFNRLIRVFYPSVYDIYPVIFQSIHTIDADKESKVTKILEIGPPCGGLAGVRKLHCALNIGMHKANSI